MISQERRTTVHTLLNQGVYRKKIARLVDIDIKTVRTILTGKTDDIPPGRKDKVIVDDALLEELHQSCNGYVQRMHELLTENAVYFKYYYQ